ncbi:ceramidase domain-containing protein [Emticicia sp. SJ17W-69]|uniref:ceramidase domain-containing protein n=1 Tax=Emticicia sp. SJ17W-69 TaxID=3421657 RepID=UPI003EBF2424
MTKQLFLKCLIKSFIFTIIMIVIWMGLNTFLNGHIWDGMTISKSALTVEYCEFNNVEKLFHQSMNTYSNLTYFFFGMLIIQIAWEDFKNKAAITQNLLEKFPILSGLMGICFIYLCFGSAFFHASLTYLGQRVDMNGTYSISISLLGIGFYHVFHQIDFSERAKKLWFGTLVCIIIGFLKIALMISSSQLLPAMILLLMILIATHFFQFRKEKSLILGILGFILMFVAVKIRTLDVQKIGCDPYSWYQGHAVWHLLTAMSSFCSYAFFRFSKK